MTEEEFNDDEEIEVEILEFVLENEEIDELITKLNELKQTKKSIQFEIDEDTDLLIHHEDNPELEIDEGDEEETEEKENE